jgi:hypothetical protein
MATEVEICNSALSKLGVEPLNTLSDNTKKARLCAKQYSKIRDWLLRRHPWNFAVKQITLTPESTAPTFGYQYQYILPSDFIRLYKNNDPDYEYTIQGKRLLSNQPTVDLLYVYQVTVPDTFDATFTELLATFLAADMCYALVQSRELTAQLTEQGENYLREIRSINAQEKWPDSLNPDFLINARRS